MLSSELLHEDFWCETSLGMEILQVIGDTERADLRDVFCFEFMFEFMDGLVDIFPVLEHLDLLVS